jgi:hypothetical protein
MEVEIHRCITVVLLNVVDLNLLLRCGECFWRVLLLLLLLLTAIGLSPGGSSPTLVQTKIKIHKTTIITKQLQNIEKHKTTK